MSLVIYSHGERHSSALDECFSVAVEIDRPPVVRRPLALVAAACVASALTLPSWGGDSDTTGGQVPEPGAERTFGLGDDGVSVREERHGESWKATPSEGSRMSTESSFWARVDRAFPGRASGESEFADAGVGNLEWDRVYTRRLLLSFPVELGPETAVDSVALRTEVTWSYDCVGDSHVELHRVDPFDETTTWNDQPASHALLDTRNVRGGRPECSVEGGVEFDVTEAYRRALDHGESHLHLRLNERDEAGSTAWRRFDVEDTPPVLLVEHHTPSSTVSFDPPERIRRHSTENVGAPTVEPALERVLFERHTLEVTVIEPVPPPGGPEQVRFRGRERVTGATTSRHRRRAAEAIARARGPPATGRTPPPVRRSQGIGEDGTPTLSMRPSTGSRHASRSARAAGSVALEASRWARPSVVTEGTVPATGLVETLGEVRFQGREGRASETGEHPCGVSRGAPPCGRPRWPGPVRVRGRHTDGLRAARGTPGRAASESVAVPGRPGCGRRGLRCSRGRTRRRPNADPSSPMKVPAGREEVGRYQRPPRPRRDR